MKCCKTDLILRHFPHIVQLDFFFFFWSFFSSFRLQIPKRWNIQAVKGENFCTAGKHCLFFCNPVKCPCLCGLAKWTCSELDPFTPLTVLNNELIINSSVQTAYLSQFFVSMCRHQNTSPLALFFFKINFQHSFLIRSIFISLFFLPDTSGVHHIRPDWEWWWWIANHRR